MDDFERKKTLPAGPEREMLESFLDFHRATVLKKVEGLDDAQLLSRPLPSTMTLLGLVKHLAYVERWWFRAVFGGLELDFPDNEADPEADFRILPGETGPQIIEFYRQEVRLACQAIAGHNLDEMARLPGEENHSLRWIMLHMIEETARHNGHADFLREAIDGRTGV